MNVTHWSLFQFLQPYFFILGILYWSPPADVCDGFQYPQSLCHFTIISDHLHSDSVIPQCFFILCEYIHVSSTGTLIHSIIINLLWINPNIRPFHWCIHFSMPLFSVAPPGVPPKFSLQDSTMNSPRLIHCVTPIFTSHQNPCSPTPSAQSMPQFAVISIASYFHESATLTTPTSISAPHHQSRFMSLPSIPILAASTYPVSCNAPTLITKVAVPHHVHPVPMPLDSTTTSSSFTY